MPTRTLRDGEKYELQQLLEAPGKAGTKGTYNGCEWHRVKSKGETTWKLVPAPATLSAGMGCRGDFQPRMNLASRPTRWLNSVMRAAPAGRAGLRRVLASQMSHFRCADRRGVAVGPVPAWRTMRCSCAALGCPRCTRMHRRAVAIC